jgi:hypothetical protein
MHAIAFNKSIAQSVAGSKFLRKSNVFSGFSMGSGSAMKKVDKRCMS